MKLKINKACDLSSISVLPPPSRRSNALSTAPQASQQRSQPSQQSFSQGPSSQHGMFSQLSQNSLDEVLTNDQRFSSQERESSVRKNSFFSPLNYAREDNQIALSRSSAIGKWNSTSLPNHKCQISDEVEHRIGIIETSLNRFGMILDSMQSDIMQVTKGSKEILLEMEGMRQKLLLHGSSLQQMSKGQEDIKVTIERGLQMITDRLSRDVYQDKLREISLTVSTLEQQIEASLLKSQNDLLNTFTKEVQAAVSILTDSKRKDPVPHILPPKGFAHLTAAQKTSHPHKNPAVPSRVYIRAPTVPKEEVGGWKSVKADKTISSKSVCKKEHQETEASSSKELERECRVIIDSDEDIDGGFSCLIEGKETENKRNFLFEEAKEETERILRKARREKRKYCNPIIIN